MKRIIRLWAVAAVMAAMLAMSASASLAKELPPQSCTGIATAQEQMQASPPLEKPPPGVPFSVSVKCEV
jgi:hypothetical protein